MGATKDYPLEQIELGNLHAEEQTTTMTEPGSQIVEFKVTPDDPTRNQWMRLIETSEGFNFLHDPKEDVYTMEDGESI